jgi:hypothetical protein
MNGRKIMRTIIKTTVALLTMLNITAFAQKIDLGKMLSGAGKAANDAIKTASKAMEPKGPMAVIAITDIPSMYNGCLAQVIAAIVEDPTNACMPASLVPAYQESYSKSVMADGVRKDSVAAGKVNVYTPCDNKKRLITVTFSPSNGNKNCSAGFIYAKGAGKDACKSKNTMPAYSLSDSQTFNFNDFITNESCKETADGVKGKNSSSEVKKTRKEAK